MRPVSRLLLALLAPLLSLGCGPREGGAEPSVHHEATNTLQPCVGARFIARLDPDFGSSEPCQLAALADTGWRASVLFAGGSPGVATLAQPLPGELGNYCAYEWTRAGAPATQTLLDAIAATPRLEPASAAFDCVVAREQGRPTDEPGQTQPVQAAMLRAFQLNIGWVSGEQLAASPSTRAAVEVALVDSATQASIDDPAFEAHHPHAGLLGAMIRDIACPGSPSNCALGLRYVLALPRVDAEHAPDWQRGGARGTPADVALGVYEAVARWRARGQSSKLVLNLSLGWEPNPSPRAPDLALVSALEYAACEGVLVFAAAGNNADSSCDDHRGPLTPASLETQLAPDPERCRSLGFSTTPTRSGDSTSRPLVYAVGGLDERGQPLANTRPGGQPRLSSSASNALAQTEQGDYTMALSGSSVAAAVASGAAALLWSYRPSLSPHQIVEQLYATGWDSSTPADFGLSSDALPTVHRLSICAALEQVCASESGPACPPLRCASTTPAEDGHRGQVREAMAERRARAPKSVKVFHNSASPVAVDCEDLGPSLARALGQPDQIGPSF